MKKISTFPIFLIGYNLYYLRMATVYNNTLVKRGSEPFLLKCIRSTQETLEEINCSPLVQKEMVKWINKLSKYKKESHLSQKDKDELKENVIRWYEILRNELSQKFCFFIEDNGKSRGAFYVYIRRL